MKKLLVIVLFAGLYTNLAAQSREKIIYKWGAKVGMNYCNMNFNRGYGTTSTVKNIWKSGFNVGFLLQVPLNSFLVIQPEYSFSNMKGEDVRIQSTFSLSYFSLPVLLKATLAKRISVFAGPEFNLLIKAMEETRGEKDNITHDTEERSFSFTSGVEIRLTNSFSIDARYSHGINNVGIGQRSAVSEFKWNGTSINLALRL